MDAEQRHKLVIRLLRKPGQTIPRLMAGDPDPWALPLGSFFLISFAQCVLPVAAVNPEAPWFWAAWVAGLLALAGVAYWVVAVAPVAHVGAVILRSKETLAKTVRALGYALFWPGLLGILVAFLAALTLDPENIVERTAGSVSYAYGDSCLPLALFAAVQLWALGNSVLAMRIVHRFSWARAVAAFLVPAIIMGSFAAVVSFVQAP